MRQPQIVSRETGLFGFDLFVLMQNILAFSEYYLHYRIYPMLLREDCNERSICGISKFYRIARKFNKAFVVHRIASFELGFNDIGFT
ncbi:hypothetical protein L596_002290 [Steinernema carpocapsae]|uniref:Uncharacterized protein n=1 Tax=Steinernema carpocapsae TaxID=34508 RepID=A0A4U8UNV0_STECR|nr:hypothetical protein L596_002290 [Steinernema carpocapsae]